MTIGTTRRLGAAFLDAAAVALLLCAPMALPAQTVLLNEVRADGNGHWIELHNRGTSAVDLSQWSLHQCTATAGMPRNYWWPFPNGTTLAAGAFLRVHWFQAIPGSVPPGEVYTGDTPYHFLFGLGAEPLAGTAGALGLLRSQANTMMNSSTVIEDWVSWGQSGFLRESLAVQAGVWNTARFAPAFGAAESLARNTPMVGTFPSREQEWFVDATPTPSSQNVSGVQVHSYGLACTATGNHLFGAPTLHTNSLPLIGNGQFGYTVDNTTGVFGELMLLAFSAAAAPTNQPSLLPYVTGSTCREVIAHNAVLTVVLVPTSVLQTHVPMSLGNLGPAFVGLELHAQAMIFDWLPNAWPPYQGVSNAVRITVGQ